MYRLREFVVTLNVKTDHRNNLSIDTLKSILITKNFLSKDNDIINFEPNDEMLNA